MSRKPTRNELIPRARPRRPEWLINGSRGSLERLRDIRASERRMYLRVREILALAADYQPDEPGTQVFFHTVRNKLHCAG